MFSFLSFFFLFLLLKLCFLNMNKILCLTKLLLPSFFLSFFLSFSFLSFFFLFSSSFKHCLCLIIVN